MKIEDEITEVVNNFPTVVDPTEAENIVESLQKFDLRNVGSTKWMDQHRKMERLNLQAHQCAMSNSDEYVLEAFLTFNKLETLIHDLLLIEAWKEFIFPLLSERLSSKNSMRLYFILYHEATVINLLEVFLYHKHVCEAGGDVMLELVDYAARKLTRLNNSVLNYRNQNLSHSSTETNAIELASTLANRSSLEELTQHYKEIDFKVCISTVSITRFLCEHAEAMPLGVVSRISDTHDLLILIIPLIENPPWTKRLDSGKWQKLIDQNWKEVKPIDLLKITKLEGQPWIALYHLLSKKVFRERYHLNNFRKGQLLRVRKYINDTLLDQLPFLADIQRYMDELALSEVQDSNSLSGSNNVFMFQQVAVMREKILKNNKWDEIVNYQLENVFTMTDKTDKDLIAMADLYSSDLTENIMENSYANSDFN
jgi:hypothetical protein